MSGTGNKEYLVFGEFWRSTSHSLHEMAPLLLRHSPKLDEFTHFRRRYRVESRPSSKARKNRKHVYIYINVKQERIAHLNVRSVASHENFYLLKQTVTTKNFPGYTTSGRIEGHTREAAEYSSMSKIKPASLKNGPQYLKATINNYGWKCGVRDLNLFFSVQFIGHRMLPSIS